MRTIIIFALAFVIVLFFGCSNDNPTGPDFNDTESPTVSITYPANLHVTYGTETLRADASDNDEISKVEFFVDGMLVGTDQTEPYEYSVDFSNYDEGTHSITAKAYDRSGNSAVSDPISVIYVYDFAPSGNGYIKVEIIHYIEDGTLDDFSDGDPYFIFKLVWNDDSSTQYSEVFNGRYELWNPYFYEFDVDDNTKQFYLSVWVYDDDTADDDWVDYTPDPDGRAYRFTLDTRSLPWEQTYDGSDDGVSSEPDCELQIRVTIVTN